MAALGSYILLATFVVCAYAVAVSVAGARRGSRRLVESGIGAVYLVAALMTVASGIIVHAFVTEDYSIKYVQRYSDSVQPLFYKVTSYWGGLDGSIMFWVFILSLFSAVAVAVNRERHRELMPYVVAVMSVVQMFFLFLMIVHKNPFETFLLAVPADGQGLNPLLQNFYMVIHPPSLYIGFVGMTIPYAFGMAALFTGHLDDSWLRAVRRWMITSSSSSHRAQPRVIELSGNQRGEAEGERNGHPDEAEVQQRRVDRHVEVLQQRIQSLPFGRGLRQVRLERVVVNDQQEQEEHLDDGNRRDNPGHEHPIALAVDVHRHAPNKPAA